MKLDDVNKLSLWLASVSAAIGGLTATFVMLHVMKNLPEMVYIGGNITDMIIGILLAKYVTGVRARRKVLVDNWRWVICMEAVIGVIIVVASLIDPVGRYLAMVTVGVVGFFISNAVEGDMINRQMCGDRLTDYNEVMSRYRDTGRLIGFSAAFYIATMDIDPYRLSVLALSLGTVIHVVSLWLRASVTDAE